MKTSTNGRRLIEGFEGLILQSYDDHDDRVVNKGDPVKGTLTIGYGHTGHDVYEGEKITKDQADQLLSDDLAGAEKDVAKYVKVPINQNQFDALVSFQFNTGWLGHEHCSLLTALNAGNYQLADEDFMLYDRAQGQVLVGLDRRRTAEKALFNTPVPVGTNAARTSATSIIVTGAAGAAAVHTHQDLLPYVVGLFIALGAVGLFMHWYENRK